MENSFCSRLKTKKKKKKIKDQNLKLPVISGSELQSCQLDNFLYNRAWCNKKKTDSESENLSSSLDSVI